MAVRATATHNVRVVAPIRAFRQSGRANPRALCPRRSHVGRVRNAQCERGIVDLLVYMALAREEAGVEPAFGRELGARAGAAERLRDRGDHADLSAAVHIPPAGGDLARVRGFDGCEPSGHAALIRATIAAAGTTSSIRHPLVVPTSMYSMKRRMCPLPRK